MDTSTGHRAEGPSFADLVDEIKIKQKTLPLLH